MYYFYPGSILRFTIFAQVESSQWLREAGIVATDHKKKADIFIVRKLNEKISPTLAEGIRDNMHGGRPILLWTHEPRFSPTAEPIVYIENFPVHIMNMYTGNVYFSNYTFNGVNINQLLPRATTVEFAERPIAGLASYVQEDRQGFVLNGTNLDLGVKRQQLLIDARARGLADLYGRNWPEGFVLGNSRDRGWQQSKLEILRNYQFNICMENTSYPFYCTEKIWDSIKCYCLPIYSSFNTKIYETFPENSFIDYDAFSNHQELLTYIQQLSKEEWLHRMNTCIDVFNHLYQTVNFKEEKEKALWAAVNKIRELCEAYRATHQHKKARRNFFSRLFS